MVTTKKPLGRPSRSEVVTVRLDPKLRYLVDLAARKQRRTVSSFIEWAIERGLDAVMLADDAATVWKQADLLWDVDEGDRFVNVAVRYPELLTHDEQVLWKLIRENGYCWRGRYDQEDRWTWTVQPSAAIIERIREHWNDFKAAASGDAEAKKRLPTWKATQPAGERKKGKFDDIEDDIPF